MASLDEARVGDVVAVQRNRRGVKHASRLEDVRAKLTPIWAVCSGSYVYGADDVVDGEADCRRCLAVLRRVTRSPRSIAELVEQLGLPLETTIDELMARGDLRLNTSVYNRLSGRGYHSLEQLASSVDEDLMDIRNFGEQSLRHLAYELRKLRKEDDGDHAGVGGDGIGDLEGSSTGPP